MADFVFIQHVVQIKTLSDYQDRYLTFVCYREELSILLLFKSICPLPDFLFILHICHTYIYIILIILGKDIQS